MQVKKTYLNDTKVQLSIIADQKQLGSLKAHVLKKLAPQVKVQGFREGKVPLEIVEKNISDSALQAEFIEEAINHMYGDAMNDLKLRPVSNPNVSLKKFVPYTELEFEAELEVVGDIVLPDYHNLKVPMPKTEVSAEDIKGVIESLQTRMAVRKPADRPAKAGDELTINFDGSDSEGKPINGASGKDYPIVLGSNTFIPGFEEHLIGLSAGESQTFTITFPKDYGVSALQNKAVTFAVTVTAVNEMVKPKADDAFAAQAGPFKTLKELKDDVKKQLTAERQYQADRDYENDIIKAIAAKTRVSIPKILIDEQIDRLWADIQQNLVYRGQTVQEFLATEGKTEAEFKEKQLAPEAKQRVKGGLILSEIAENEKLTVTPEELQIRIQLLKGQYKDPAMQSELDKPANQRDIVARILTEKTLAKLVSYVSK